MSSSIRSSTPSAATSTTPIPAPSTSLTPSTTSLPSSAPTKRSSRLHLHSQKTSSRSILDAATRAHANAARLAQLEADNVVEDVTVDEAWDETEEEQVMAGAAKGKGKGGGKRKREGEGGKVKKVRMTLEEIVDKLGMREEGVEGPNWVSVAAGPCSHPPRPFCSVCGYRSAYTCVRCGQRYCSIGCQRTHQDTRCNKF